MNKRFAKIMQSGMPRVTLTQQAVRDRELKAIVDTARAMAKPQRQPGQRKRRNNKNKSSPTSGGPSTKLEGSLGVPGSVTYATKGAQGEFPFAMDEIVTVVKKQEGNHLDIIAVPINPGLPQFYSLASVPGQMYDLWGVEPKKGDFVEFYWKPLVTEFKVGQGNVVISCDYDSLDSQPASAEAMLKTDPHSEGMPHLIQCLRLDPAALMKGGDGKSKYVRTGIVTGDLKTYDGGTLYLSVDGLPDDIVEGTALGELRVRYRIRFSKLNPERIQGISQGNPRNRTYVNITHAMNNEGLALMDTGGTNFSDLTLFELYWDYGLEAQPISHGLPDPFRPDEYPDAAIPGVVLNTNHLRLPEGRFLLTINYVIVANDEGGNPGNINVFRIKIVPDSVDVATYPAWVDTTIATHHDSGAGTANVFTVLGTNGSVSVALPGGFDYGVEYQLVTRAEEGAEFYANSVVLRLQ